MSLLNFAPKPKWTKEQPNTELRFIENISLLLTSSVTGTPWLVCSLRHCQINKRRGRTEKKKIHSSCKGIFDRTHRTMEAEAWTKENTQQEQTFQIRRFILCGLLSINSHTYFYKLSCGHCLLLLLYHQAVGNRSLCAFSYPPVPMQRRFLWTSTRLSHFQEPPQKRTVYCLGSM